MAGIGFELKKLLSKKNFLFTVGGYFYATFVSVGPVVISVLLLIILRYVMRATGTGIETQNLVLSGIMYAFIGALTLSSITTMLLSRFISDSIYSETDEKVLPSMITALSMNLMITGSATFCFYAFYSQLDIMFEILCYFLTLLLSCMFIIMVYVSAVKDYKRITVSFIIGSIIGIASTIFLIRNALIKIEYSMLIGITISFFVIAILLLYNVSLFFKDKFDKTYTGYKEFITYFKKYPSLIFINLFYNIAIFAHNAIIWSTDIGTLVEDTYFCSPMYDVPAFLAMVTILPAMVIFVVKTETTFFDYYKEYIKKLSGGGTLQDLRYAGKNIKEAMYKAIISLLQQQLVITVLCILIAKFTFPMIGMPDISFTFFGYLAVGYFCIIAVHILSTIILYFDDRKTALKIMSVFIATQLAFVYVSTLIGPDSYGLGTLASGFVTLVYSFIQLNKMINNLDYRLYCSQPINETVAEG